MAVAAWMAEAAAAVAAGQVVPSRMVAREELAELNRAWTQLARLGTNLNQAVRVANATGEVGKQLAAYAAACDRRMRKVEQAVEDLVQNRYRWAP